MEEKLKQLDALISRKMQINSTEIEKAVEMIYEIFSYNCDAKWLAKCLFKASGKVTSAFITEHYLKFDAEIRTMIATHMANGVNGTKSAFLTGCCTVAAIIDVDPRGTDFVIILKRILQFSQDKGARIYNENKVKSFKTHILEKLKRRFFDADFGSMSKCEKGLLFGFVMLAVKEDTPDYVMEWRKKYLDENFIAEKEKTEVQPVSEKGSNGIPSKSDNQKNTENIVGFGFFEQAEKLVAEMQKLYNNAFVKNNAFSDLENDIAKGKEENAIQKEELEKLKRTVSNGNVQSDDIEKRLTEQQLEIEDLKKRLKNFSMAAEFSKNQEIERFKNNIGNAVRLEYSDYCEIKGDSISNDNYEALKLILGNVFKVFRKNGINVE